MNRVNFILIGAMKSGTTTLADHLRCHPKVYIPKFKEPQFFSRNEKYCRGVEWYESLFDEAGSDQICGEASTCYSRWPVYSKVPERIHTYSPKMRFIYLVRDPADRAYSHYRHGMLKNEFCFTSFQDAMDNNQEILCASRYMAQINQYLEYFPRDRFLFIRFEDLNNDNVIRDLFQFLSLDDIEFKITRNIASNTAGYGVVKEEIVRNLRKIKNASSLGKVLDFCLSEKKRRYLLGKVADLSTNSIIGKKMIQNKRESIQSMTEQERQGIYKSCAQDTREFQEFSRLDLSGWYR
jgi:hypothetical protein